MFLTTLYLIMFFVFKWAFMALLITHNEEKRIKSLYGITGQTRL